MRRFSLGILRLQIAALLPNGKNLSSPEGQLETFTMHVMVDRALQSSTGHRYRPAGLGPVCTSDDPVMQPWQSRQSTLACH